MLVVSIAFLLVVCASHLPACSATSSVADLERRLDQQAQQLEDQRILIQQLYNHVNSQKGGVSAPQKQHRQLKDSCDSSNSGSARLVVEGTIICHEDVIVGNASFSNFSRRLDLLTASVEKIEFDLTRQCTGKYFDESDGCAACSSSCNTCYGDADTCTSCSDAKFLKAGACLSSCGEGFFGNSDTWTCEPCHKTCAECTGPLDFECTSCHGGGPLAACPDGEIYLAAPSSGKCCG
eukprot:INCI4963.35.p1 GENE.INCI4963.35~~INCI4963.35.p1  ORF type:complete len:236 (+),score=37.08 INCI4963.35:165-872(+)